MGVKIYIFLTSIVDYVVKFQPWDTGQRYTMNRNMDDPLNVWTLWGGREIPVLAKNRTVVV
jgi:hypothetical protein